MNLKPPTIRVRARGSEGRTLAVCGLLPLLGGCGRSRAVPRMPGDRQWTAVPGGADRWTGGPAVGRTARPA